MKCSGKRLLITGAGGHVGSNMASYFASRGFDVYGMGLKESPSKKYFMANIEIEQEVFSVLKRVEPFIIIHAASLSSLGECEKNPKKAYDTNVKGTENLAVAVSKLFPDSKLVFMSSDYVFDGLHGNYNEKDTSSPATVYGKTKLEGENIIKSNLNNYIICRSANIYGRGGNFFRFLTSNLGEEREIEIFSDTYYTPTYIDYFMDSLHILLEDGFNGTLHITGTERVTRYEFALEVADAMGKSRSLINPMTKPVSELIAKDSSLDSSMSRKILMNYCPTIKNALEHHFSGKKYPFRFLEQNHYGVDDSR